MRRKITADLEEWLASGRSTCPIILGARQVGKTYIVDEFLRSNFEHYKRLDFSKDVDAREVFDGSLDVDTIVRNLTMTYKTLRFKPGETALFFDEIQNCPRAQTALKSFAEDGRYKVIASGSLLGFRMKEVPLIPAGYWERMYLGPMDFEEFLWAIGMPEDAIAEIREMISEKKPLEAGLPPMMRYLRQYAIVGGMPKAVKAFAETETYEKIHRIHRNIIEDYKNDIIQYADPDLKDRITACFSSIPSILAKENKRFLFADIDGGPGYKVGSAYYGKALEWLDMAFISMSCENLTELHEPLEERRKPSEFKVYLRDTGLLLSLYGGGLGRKILNGDMDVNKGAIAENLVAGMLHVQGRSLMYYAKRQERTEVDFVTTVDDSICAIEVKSGANRSCSSLNKVIGGSVKGIMFETRDIFTDEKGVDHYPLFCAAFMDCIDKARFPLPEPYDAEEMRRALAGRTAPMEPDRNRYPIVRG